jgi:hypothetical protein
MEILITESQLRRILKEEYSDKVIEQLVNKFKREDPKEDENVIRAYIKRFDKVKGDTSVLNKDIFSYSLEKLRYVLIDFFKENKPKSFKGDTDMDVVYNSDNVKIYRADSRNKCITYGKGYSFCISSYSDTDSYRKHIIRDKGTPYFVLNKNYSNRSNNGFFEEPEHIMVIIAYDGSGISNTNIGLIKFKDVFEELEAQRDVFSLDKFYSVTNANNMGETYFINFDNIVKMYPFLEGLEGVFNMLPVSEKDVKHIEFEQFAKVEMQKIIIKHKKFAFRDSCGGYLPILRDYNDLRSGEVKERFLKGEYVKYTLALKDLHGTIISQHTGKDGKAKCMKDMENEIEKNTQKLEELIMDNDKSVEGGKKRNDARLRMNPNYYNILSCEWPNEYISYLKDVYGLGVKLFYKKWAIENG